MFDSVLRVSAEEFDVNSFLKNYTLAVPFETYQKGESDILGNPNSESGFDALISESENLDEHLSEIGEFLKVNQALLVELKGEGVVTILDIGFTVESNGELAPSIRLPADLLGMLHRLDVSVEVSAYPSENQNNQQQ
jgi:hypothetical protein